MSFVLYVCDLGAASIVDDLLCKVQIRIFHTFLKERKSTHDYALTMLRLNYKFVCELTIGSRFVSLGHLLRPLEEENQPIHGRQI